MSIKRSFAPLIIYLLNIDHIMKIPYLYQMSNNHYKYIIWQLKHDFMPQSVQTAIYIKQANKVSDLNIPETSLHFSAHLDTNLTEYLPASYLCYKHHNN